MENVMTWMMPGFGCGFMMREPPGANGVGHGRGCRRTHAAIGMEAMARLAWHALASACMFCVVCPPLSADALRGNARIRKLRATYRTEKTTADNLQERVRTCWEWYVLLDEAGRRLPRDFPAAFSSYAFRTSPSGLQYPYLDQIIDALQFYTEHQHLHLGRLTLDSVDPVVVRTYTTKRLTYTVGDMPIRKGGYVRIGWQFFSDQQNLQFVDPQADNFVTLETTSRAKLKFIQTPWWGLFGYIHFPVPRISVLVEEGELRPGETVTFVIGDTSGGSKGYRVQSFEMKRFLFLAEADPTGKGQRLYVDEVAFPIIADRAAALEAIVPTIVRPGETFALRVRAVDRFRNIAASHTGTLQVHRWDREKGLGALVGRCNMNAEGVGCLDGLRLEESGHYRFHVMDAATGLSTLSNPVEVRSAETPRIFWGELHGHTGLTDGIGTVEEYFQFGRDKAFLDFISLSDHDLWMTPMEFDIIRTAAYRHNEPGRYLVYQGYEWTQDTAIGGHHNVFFRNFHGREVTVRETEGAEDLYRLLAERNHVDDVLIVPHCHQSGTWLSGDPRMKNLVEIYSTHGSFEYYGRMFLDRGYQMGLIAASDDHTSHPGFSPAMKQARNGLAAVLSEMLDRDAVFDHLKARHTYGTSGPRIYLKFLAGNARMGDVVEGNADGVRFTAEAAGTAPIERLEIVKNGGVVYTLRPQSVQSLRHIRIRFTSASRNGSPTQVVDPKNALSWDGWLKVHGCRIVRFRPLSLEQWREGIERRGEDGFRFYLMTRGEMDGLVLELDDPEAAQLELLVRARQIIKKNYARGVRTYYHDYAQQQASLEQEGVHMRVAVSDLARARFVRVIDVPHNGTLEIKPYATEETGLVQLSYADSQAASGDYYYLRVTQMDGEQAWSSPIWVK